VNLPDVWLARALLLGLVFSAILALPIYKWLLKIKSRQIVSEYVAEHQKKQGTPTMGGLIPVCAVLLAGLSVLIFDTSNGSNELLIAELVLFLGFALVGFVDDFVVPRMIKGKRGLGWKQKILMQVVIAGLVALKIPGIQHPISYGCYVLLILFFANAYNFADGMDGLASAIYLAFAGGLAGLLASGYMADGALLLPAAIAGAILPFLMLNAPPAKVFMGDVGSLPIGAALGFAVSFLVVGAGRQITIHPMPSWPRTIAAVFISGVMIYELVPVPLQIFWVKVFKKRLFKMTPVHHGFEKRGIAETRIVCGFVIAQILCSTLAVWSVLESGMPDEPQHQLFVVRSP
jgi:phospho-N-acetylmuramoyl-pentapeptide-transferase